MWDGKKFLPVGSGVNGVVNALAISEDDSTLYVGGSFDTVGKIRSPLIAAVNLKRKTPVNKFGKAEIPVPKYRLENSNLSLSHFRSSENPEDEFSAGRGSHVIF